MINMNVMNFAIFLFNIIINQTFTRYLNCDYLITTKLGMPSFFCEGHDVKVLGSTIFSLPGLNGVVNPPLKFIRLIISWSIILFFGFLSLYLTIIINNLKTVVKLLTFNKEEWKNLMSSIRIWLSIFVFFCLIFYFTVIR